MSCRKGAGAVCGKGARVSAPAWPLVMAWAESMVGAMAGVTEVFIQQPTVAWKNAMQEGRPRPWGPQMYRGVFVNAASIAPTNATQFAVNFALCDLAERMSGEPSPAQRLAAAAAGGATSALIATPAELVMLQQQKHGGTLMGTAVDVARQHGVRALFRGLESAAVRDAIYVGCYMGVAPVLREHLLATSETCRANPGWTKLGAGLFAGIAAAVSSHPFDTIRTLQAANPGSGAYYNLAFPSAFRRALSERGWSGIFAGFVPRTMRVMGAVVIISESSTRYRDALGLPKPAGLQ